MAFSSGGTKTRTAAPGPEMEICDEVDDGLYR